MLAKLVFFIVCVDVGLCGRILVLSTLMKSHVLEGVSLVEDVKGHDLYVAFSSASSDSYKGIMRNRNVNVLTFKSSNPEHRIDNTDFTKNLIDIALSDNPSKTEYELFGDQLSVYVYGDCTNMMADRDFIDKVNRLQFDLVVVDPFPIVHCLTILPYKLGIPFVSITTPYNAWSMRLPAMPSFVPVSMGTYTDKMTFKERLGNLMVLLFMQVYAQDDTALLREHMPDEPSLSWADIIRKTEIFFIHNDPILAYPIPVTPNVVTVGGLTTRPAQSLPPDFDTFASNSKHGLIIASFGSIARHLPDGIAIKMAKAFARLKQNVIWRFSGEVAVPVSDNVKLAQWVPQNDILGHKNTVLFITHSGNNGQYEALYHGVPMLAFHIFGDQHFNAKRVEHKGFGLEINLRTFTEDEFVQKIEHIIFNETYRSNIGKASVAFRDSPNPRQKAAYWINHVIKHGASHLRPSGLDMTWYEFLMLDLLAVFLVILVIGLFVISGITKLLWNIFNRLRQ